MVVSGLVTYNTYLEVLGKSGSWQQAEDVFRDMQKKGILPAVNTFTLMINIYGKVSYILQPAICSTGDDCLQNLAFVFCLRR